jgi:hypothetical protein
MTTFILHMCYSDINFKNKYGKDQRDTFVCGAAMRSEERIQTWLCAFPAPTLPGCPVKGASEFPENSGKSGFVPAVHKQMGGQIHGRRYRRIGEPPRAGSKTDYKQASRRRNNTQSHRADRQSVKAAKAAREASSGKTASDETFRRFLPALAQDMDV